MRRQVISTTEIEAAARAGGGLILGPDAVVTPAARDRARELGVRLEVGSKAPAPARAAAADGQSRLQGYCYPLSPLGKASILDDPPWHFGGDILFVAFRADPRATTALLPPPLEPGSDPGLCFAWVADIVCCGDQTRDMPYRNPARTHYVEGMVAVSCSFQGKQGYTVPYIWVDRDWSVARGWWFGWPKKLAACYLSRYHHLNPAMGPVKEGTRFSGLVERQGQTLMRAGMTITGKGRPEDLPRFGNLYMLRHVPNVKHGAEPRLLELLRMDVSNLAVGPVWTGTGELDFFPAENEELEPLRPLEILGAQYAAVGWTNPGASVLWSKDAAR